MDAESRAYMIAQGWYLEYEGSWFRIATDAPDVPGNQLPVTAYSAEIDLDGFLTNYGQVPFSMPAATPSEIADAILSGTPQCSWFNGEFQALDDAGFPVGWYPTGAWTVSAPEGENTVQTTAASAVLASEGLRHTSGAQIKPMLDLATEAGFAGLVQVVVSWQNAAGVETSSVTLDAPSAVGDWLTFQAPDWLPVRNERCVLKVVVSGNAEGMTVAVRRVRFRQNERDTGWSYIGSMDTRDPDVAYNDSLFVRYGTWIVDPAGETNRSSWAGDILSRSFTGDQVTRVADLDVSAARAYQVSGLDRYRSHTLEVVVKAGTVSVTGLTLSTENRLSVTWNRLGDYQALLALQDLVGGELAFDTRNRTIYHDPTQGDDLTTLNILWLREGSNLASFVPTSTRAALGNRCYFGGYGDGAMQLGVVVDADAVDEDGYTSQERYGSIAFAETNKDCGDIASALVQARQRANERAFPTVTYRATMADAVAALITPGDSVRVTHSSIGGTKTLRALQIDRSSESNEASVTFGARATVTDAASQYAAMRRQIDRLLNTY